MTGVVRCTLAVIALFAVLIAGVVIYVSLFFNPNQYVANVAKMVRYHSGLELHLRGHVSWHLLPWPKVSVAGVELRLPGKRSGDAPLARLGQVTINARLLPLLKGRFMAQDILIQEPQLTLYRDASGHANWMDWFKQMRQKHRWGNPHKALDMSQARLRITDGTLLYEDARLAHSSRNAPFTMVLSHINVNSLNLATSQFVPASLSMDVHDFTGYTGHLDMAAEVNAAPSSHLYALRNARVTGCGVLPPISLRQRQKLTVSLGHLDLDFPGGFYEAGRVKLNGTLHSDALPDQPIPFVGSMDLAASAISQRIIARGIELRSGNLLAMRGVFKVSGGLEHPCYETNLLVSGKDVQQRLADIGTDVKAWPWLSNVVKQIATNVRYRKNGVGQLVIDNCAKG